MFNKKHFHLLWVLAKTDFKMRYHGSFLGYIWTLLKPLLMFGVLYIVFSIFIVISIPYYQIYLLTALILWNFFAEATSAGLMSIISKTGLIKKIYFPRILVVISSTVSALIAFSFNLIIFFIIYYFFGPGFSWHILLLPIYIILLYLLIVGVSILLSVLQVKFRDVTQIWEVILQAGFFLTPIIYSLEIVPLKYWFYLFLNPMTPIIYYSRKLLVGNDLPSLQWTLVLSAGIILLLIISLFVFKKMSKNMVENL